jgi:predicted nuclease with TOPRIM domain
MNEKLILDRLERLSQYCINLNADLLKIAENFFVVVEESKTFGNQIDLLEHTFRSQRERLDKLDKRITALAPRLEESASELEKLEVRIDELERAQKTNVSPTPTLPTAVAGYMETMEELGEEDDSID